MGTKEDLAERYPMLDFRESGVTQYETVCSTLVEQAEKMPDMAERINKALQQFGAKLQYLNDYGGKRYRVEIGADAFGKLSFSLAWFCQETDPPTLHFIGGLQCDLVAQPFGSVVVGAREDDFWSINT